jgi:Q-cell neuroblast polarisation
LCRASDFTATAVILASCLFRSILGVHDLMRDNITEHPSTINVLARMNIYQEVVLAAFYRSLSFLQVNYDFFVCFNMRLQLFLFCGRIGVN